MGLSNNYADLGAGLARLADIYAGGFAEIDLDEIRLDAWADYFKEPYEDTRRFSDEEKRLIWRHAFGDLRR